jgi:hypothetical protein
MMDKLAGARELLELSNLNCLAESGANIQRDLLGSMQKPRSPNRL